VEKRGAPTYSLIGKKKISNFPPTWKKKKRDTLRGNHTLLGSSQSQKNLLEKGFGGLKEGLPSPRKKKNSTGKTLTKGSDQKRWKTSPELSETKPNKDPQKKSRTASHQGKGAEWGRLVDRERDSQKNSSKKGWPGPSTLEGARIKRFLIIEKKFWRKNRRGREGTLLTGKKLQSRGKKNGDEGIRGEGL